MSTMPRSAVASQAVRTTADPMTLPAIWKYVSRRRSRGRAAHSIGASYGPAWAPTTPILGQGRPTTSIDFAPPTTSMSNRSRALAQSGESSVI